MVKEEAEREKRDLGIARQHAKEAREATKKW